MTEERENTPPAPGASGGDTSRPPRAWPQMLRFFVVFVVIVLALLIGYKYAVDTFANDWYLFQVGRHTAALLDKVGDHSELESTRPVGKVAQQRRATLNAWDRGEDTPTAEEIAAQPDTPLTPWESYRYRIGSYLDIHDPARVRATLDAWAQDRATPTPAEVETASDEPLSVLERYRYRRGYTMRRHRTTGPRVWFVLNDGLEVELRRLSRELQRVRDQLDLTPRERRERTADLQEALDDVRAAVAAEKEEKPPNRDALGRYFVFIIVPECGAIEVMAIFLAAVVAFPTRWWKRLVGLVFGLPVMYFVNVFRLSCLAVVGALDTTKDRWIFDFSHHYVWQTIYIVFVVAVWLLWIEYVVKGRKRNGE